MTTQQDERAELIRKLNSIAAQQAKCPYPIFGSVEVMRKAAALLEADANGGEAVARVVRNGATVRLEWASADAAHNAKPGELFARPQQAAQVPLTDEQAEQLRKQWMYGEDFRLGPFMAGLRAGEAAHHIGKPAPVGINGLTEAETAASASVMGLASKNKEQ